MLFRIGLSVICIFIGIGCFYAGSTFATYHATCISWPDGQEITDFKITPQLP